MDEPARDHVPLYDFHRQGFTGTAAMRGACMNRRTALRALAAVAATGTAGALAFSGTAVANTDTARHGMVVKASNGAGHRPGGSKLLTYRGGAVSHAGRAFVVFWGSQ